MRLDEFLAEWEASRRDSRRFIPPGEMTPEQWALAMGKEPKAPGRRSIFSAQPDPASCPMPSRWPR